MISRIPGSLLFLAAVSWCGGGGGGGARAAVAGHSALNEADPQQFHVQTDGDGDRYFIYQTNNGQYRKERRLRDGSVVGTTGWVDAAGYLRLQDYIADDQGYRIYKSKTVYVGPERSIADSLKIAKSAPTDPGYGFTPAPEHPSAAARAAPPASRAAAHTTARPAPSTTLGTTASGYPLEVSVTPPPPPSSYHYRSSTYAPPPVSTYSPAFYTSSFEVSPNSLDSSGEPRFDPRPTVAPITADEADGYTPTSVLYSPADASSRDDNELDYGGRGSPSDRRLDYLNPNSYRHSGEWRRRVGTSRVRYTPPDLGDGYTPQLPQYDGTAADMRGGFRYYLPKHYHEEEAPSTDGTKTGSFGYVDPFGIRRVIYYNADPAAGFEVRKNNRYVGHDATPYDPRPL